MKRLLTAIILASLLTVSIQPLASAASILYAKYAVNLRSSPSSSGTIYKTIPKGGQVTKLSGSSNGYYRVSYKGCVGWASSGAFSSSSGGGSSGGSSGGGGRPGGFPGGFGPTLTLSKKKITLTMGDDPVTITASVKTPSMPGAGSGDGEQPSEEYTFTWTSLDPTVATVVDGVITPVGQGTCRVKCICQTSTGKITAKCKVTVKPILPTSVTLNSYSITLEAGQTYQLQATVAPDYATNKAVSWSSKKKKIAKVSNAGLVTGVKPGTTKIVCKTKSGSQKSVCVVTVVANTGSVIN